MAVRNYQEIYDQLSGSMVERFQQMLTEYSDDWGWPGHETAVSDILDDPAVDAIHIVKILEAVLDFEGGNDEFKAALAVMQYIVQHQMTEPVNPKSPLSKLFASTQPNYHVSGQAG